MHKQTIVIMTHLRLWSMGAHKGAPTLFKTVQAYQDADWRTILISPTPVATVHEVLPGVEAIEVRLGAESLISIRGFNLVARISQSIIGGFRFYRAAQKQLRYTDSPYVVYAYEVGTVLPAKLLSQRKRAPLITRFQGTILAPIPNTLKERIRRYPHFSALSTASDLVIMTDDGTQGDRVLDRLRNFSPRVFWRNGVDRSTERQEEDARRGRMLSLGISSDEIVLMTISRLARWKRVDRAIQATASLVSEGRNVSLVIVGDGPERANLEYLAAQKNVADRVHFVGSVPHGEVGSYLAGADIFLSLYDLSNLGNPLFEAMIAGKPIVTLNVGDTGRVIADERNGILIDKIDGSEVPRITEAIEGLILDPPRARMLGDGARSFAETNFWTWNERLQEEVRTVAELLHRHAQ